MVVKVLKPECDEEIDAHPLEVAYAKLKVSFLRQEIFARPVTWRT